LVLSINFSICSNQLTVLNNVILPAQLAGMPSKIARSRADASFSITQYAWVVPAQISTLLPASTIQNDIPLNTMMAYRLNDGSAAILDAFNQQINKIIPNEFLCWL
jgi:hypothetical protein